ncbi:MAG TPA: sigma-70 family RNA polymerase sigma factor [Saprospiraceae bacterium]|nr:sigma-70 family RNA polymerase sigma factor [Saprospiraceae bacterium]HRO08915.1 sigma-70 family RNA polymerase sigma factor [Saprospiraceae bacterium]HRO72356.1 sigma-70 family RNA polymerase sigma factor [Saprospiraceae bacterium]HRP42347.1 sigma-70 family RNA polymerase sigma factor [Saprospiraceae bacterium]
MSHNPFSNPKNYEVIFKEYFSALVNYVFKFINDIELSKDIVQSTFLKLWNNREHIEIQTSVKAYLYMMTKNTMIDHIRKNKKMPTEEMNNLSLENIQDTVDIDFDPFLVRNALEKSLGNVKDKTREIFVLNKFEGLSYDEIAEYLHISKRMVDYNIAITLKHLKEQLKNHPDIFN